MPETLLYSGTLVRTSCWCGIHLAVPKELYDMAQRRKNHGIYCPLGHEFIFDNTIEEQLKCEREKSARLISERDQLEASNRGLKGAVTKKKKELARVRAGVCPCCRRSFTNLARHMETKHPRYKS